MNDKKANPREEFIALLTAVLPANANWFQARITYDTSDVPSFNEAPLTASDKTTCVSVKNASPMERRVTLDIQP